MFEKKKTPKSSRVSCLDGKKEGQWKLLEMFLRVQTLERGVGSQTDVVAHSECSLVYRNTTCKEYERFHAYQPGTLRHKVIVADRPINEKALREKMLFTALWELDGSENL